ncbi:alpha-L-fucosidase [Snuella sedimenti]|uniref:alpha-L-fucosidase n=1 Tax=Snuella sedimenti TaxID=2798802 RepID=A0A8J7JD41_9FLAO|nr:alpha-L-fucosidase [Snuella sedimenti]MBJ6368779.1 alpha-L-fucosidase [Snuella sedimenti]
MYRLSSLLIIALVFVSCNQKKGLVLNTSNTIEIKENDSKDSIVLKAAHVVPTENQYEALKNEFIAFIHFGPNTFTRMEWGNGMEDPKIFDLKTLDTDQWCEAMKSAGMKMVVITVKHHDGFVLWQSRYTKHGIMSTGFKDGKGDILKELSESCQKYGLKLGVYLSPADLYQIENEEGLYGNLSKYSDRTIPRSVEGRPFANKTTFTFNVDDYNEYFLNQLFELLTEYGPIHEVWFDGAHPKRKGGQKYNYLAWKELISTLAPEAVVFGKQDIRWCGNEAGGTRDTEWNVIPYKTNPHEMNSFADITGEDIGSREKLYDAKFLHYQQAETNTSIREGWFYRDEDKQKVRSADDVFDIYERSVGGNSTFLLNIPPNRDGKFSPEDVKVLNEVGQRIKATYGTNLFEGASGPSKVLDADTESYELLDGSNEIIISTKAPVTINRLVLQEAITTHGERIEEHALDAWIDNAWQEVAVATNVGYKRILRFQEVTSDKFRIRVLASRFTPAVSNVTAHYYKTRPPQLTISRDAEGKLNIAPKKHDFGWKPHGEDAVSNLNAGYEIRYTIDGSTPTKTSKLFKTPETIASTEVKAVAIDKEEVGSVASRVFGILKTDWKIVGTDSGADKHPGTHAFDENPNTYWQSEAKGKTHYIAIDLGRSYNLKGFAYTPQTRHVDGMIEQGIVKVSQDGKQWKTVETFEFGNLINDPVRRNHYFKNTAEGRFIRIESKTIAGGKQTAAIAELDVFE